MVSEMLFSAFSSVLFPKKKTKGKLRGGKDRSFFVVFQHTILITFFAVCLWNNKMKTRKEILKLRDNSLLYNNIRQKSFQSFRFNDKMDKIPSKNKKIHIFSRFQLYSRAYVRVWTLRSWILLVNLKVIISLYITICYAS